MKSLIDPIVAYQGEQIVIRVEVNDQNNADRDLTGTTVLLRIGDIRAMTTSLQYVGTVIDGVTGIIEAVISKEDTAALDPKTYDFMFLVSDGSLVPQVVAVGELELRYTLQAP